MSPYIKIDMRAWFTSELTSNLTDTKIITLPDHDKIFRYQPCKNSGLGRDISRKSFVPK